jgi:glutathione-regulated potassium-efflux system protein KefB
MENAHHGVSLLPLIALLGAAVVAAPLFKRLGLGSVLGYLAAGVAIGPFGLGVFDHPAAILPVAELGVVLFLFLVGLEMQPRRLWSMRSLILGPGLSQVIIGAALLTGVGLLTGFPVASSFAAGAGFVLTSSAIVMQMLQERGALSTPYGERVVAILLLEDVMIVPMLAAIAFLAPGTAQGHAGIDARSVAIGIACIAGVIIAGRYLLNPLFGLMARAQAREFMTAAALLVVLGAAHLMELGGLSMAMGAFLAGVLLSESRYRHQLEVDIEPFRGLLLGVFFTAVGMSLDLEVVGRHWQTILGYTAAYMVVKGLVIFAVARFFGLDNRQALDRTLLMALGGEFAFVLFSAAAAAGIIDAEQNAMLTAVVILSMVVSPLLIAASRLLPQRAAASPEGLELPGNSRNPALVVGFGRFGQIASQFLFARGYELTIIDTDVEMIETAQTLGFKVYYGDGTRLDVLTAAGLGDVRVLLVCTDIAESTTRIVELAKSSRPDLPVLARAVDRVHSLQLVRERVDYQIRETFESALALGSAALEVLGSSATEATRIEAEIRHRDQERFQLEVSGGIDAGRILFSPTAAADARVSPPSGDDRTL